MQSDISKVHTRHELSFREKILGCFSKPISHPKLVSFFYLSCGTSPFSFLRKAVFWEWYFLSCWQDYGYPVQSKWWKWWGKSDWTHKAEASEWDSSLKGEHPEVILWPCNSKHQTLQGRESCCQACVLVSANPSEMPGSSEGPFYPCLQDCSTLWWYWKTHCPFLPLSFIFVLCLSVSILRWGHAPSDDCFPVLYLVLSVNSVYFFQCNIA